MFSNKTKLIFIYFILSCSTAFSQGWITHTVPTKNQLNVPANSSIKLIFNRSILQSSITSHNLIVKGSVKGMSVLNFEYNTSDNSLTIFHQQDFKIGEKIFVTVTGSIQDSSGNLMTNAVNFSFTSIVNGGTNNFTQGAKSYSTGNFPIRITSADFDNDNDIDIIVCNRNSFTLEMFKNNGQAGFEKNVFYYGVDSPTNIAASDFDNDGDMDIAVCWENNNVVLFFRNDGTGQLSSSANLMVNNRPLAIIFSNFDADGYPDLAVGNWGDNIVTIYKNNGNGGFNLYSSLYAGYRPISLVSADFNSDGYMDLAIGIDWAPAVVAIAKNNGQGNFTISQNIPVRDRPYSITENDFDNNGYPDLCSANLTDNSLSVMLNTGESFSSNLISSGGTFALCVTHGDFDSDGDIDLTLGFSLSNNISVYANNGSGSFTGQIYSNSQGPSSCILSNDFDNDGDLDLATSNHYINNLSIFYNDNIVGIDPVSNDIPASFSLTQNFPNPFNPSTTINFTIPKSGVVEISIWNSLGRQLGLLMNKEITAGAYSINFDAGSFNLTSGVYFYKITAGPFSETKKMLLLK